MFIDEILEWEFFYSCMANLGYVVALDGMLKLEVLGIRQVIEPTTFIVKEKVFTSLSPEWQQNVTFLNE